MKFFKSLADDFIDMFNMREEARDWVLVTSWLTLAVLFLAGSGVHSIVAMWQTYGAGSLILDIIIGMPAVTLFIGVAITYGFVVYELAKVLKDEEENDEYYD